MRQDLGPDLWALALRAFKEDSSPDQIASGIQDAMGVSLSGMPPVFLKASAAWVAEAAHLLRQRQQEVQSKRRQFRNTEAEESTLTPFLGLAPRSRLWVRPRK